MRRWLTSFGFAALGLIVGCSAPEEPAPVPSPGGTEESPAILTRARAIVDASMAATEPGTFRFCDGTTGTRLVRAPRELDLPRGSWSPAMLESQETPGRVAARFPLEDMPLDFLLADDGSLVVARPERVPQSVAPQLIEESNPLIPDLLRVDPAGGQEVFAEGSAGTLQWDAEGTALLRSGLGVYQEVAWPGGEVLRDWSGTASEGYLQYASDGGRVILVQPKPALYSAELPIRISIEWREAGAEAEAEPAVLPLAALGTLPQVDAAWGHARQPYQIDPIPAPLLRLGPDFGTAGLLTSQNDWVDLDPQAARDGRLVFVRAQRRGGLSSRAWTTLLNDRQVTRPLTAEPTYDVAISPGGEWIGTLVVREGEAVIVVSETEALLARDLAPAEGSRAAFREAVKRALADVRSAFSGTPQGATEQDSDFGNRVVTAPPDRALLETMDLALRNALREHLGLDLARDFRAIGQLDGFFAAIDGLWPEEPATVTAVAAVYGNALVRAGEGEARWSLEGSTAELGYTGREFTVANNILYTLHNPFFAARERLAGLLPLHDLASAVLSAWEQPVYLVENFSAPTAQSVAVEEAARGGLDLNDAEAVTSVTLRNLLADGADNDVVLLSAANFFEGAEPDSAAALVALFRLAENNPTSAEVLLRLAGALSYEAQDDAAERLAEQAARLRPGDVDVMLAVANLYFDVGELEKSIEAFEHVARIDCGGEAEMVVEEELAILRELLAEEREAAP